MPRKNQINESVIIIDFDGTLIVLEVEWDSLRKDLKDICEKELNINESFQNIDESLFKIKKRFGDRYFDRLLERITFYEIQGYKGKKVHQVINFLDSLSKDKKLAIFSSNCRKTIERVIPDLGLKIDYIVAKEDVSNPKPSGEGIKKILKHFNVKPVDAIFIGDSKNDILAGKDAEIKTKLWKELLDSF